MRTERVKFRYFSMPCCGFQLCWVNPRMPIYCPECGKGVFATIRESVRFSDDEAILQLHEG